MRHQQSTSCGFLVCHKISNTFAIISSKYVSYKLYWKEDYAFIDLWTLTLVTNTWYQQYINYNLIEWFFICMVVPTCSLTSLNCSKKNVSLWLLCGDSLIINQHLMTFCVWNQQLIISFSTLLTLKVAQAQLLLFF